LIYVSDNDGLYQPWSAFDTTSAIFNGEVDHTYRFFSIAREGVGNVEVPPDSFDVKVKILVTGIESEESVLKVFSLHQNYPNPFNPETNIKYELPKRSKVTLTIYNILGQKIKTLVDEEKQPGFYSVKWDGTNDFNRKVSSGIYIYQIRAGKFIETKKMVFLK
jgi:hypothetical protein